MRFMRRQRNGHDGDRQRTAERRWLQFSTGVSMRVDDVIIHDLERYRTEGYPWDEWDLLRAEAPVYWYERDGIEPFWAITRYDDVKFVSGENERFINGGGRLRLDMAERDAEFWRKYRRRMEEKG